MSSERPKDPTASEMLEVRPEDFFLGDKVAWEGPRLAVTDPATIGKLRRKALSPSTAAAMEDCTARWAIERLLPRSNNPFGAAELGTAAHAVLEDLYKLPSFQRSEEKAMNILLAHAKEAWPGQDDETFAKRGMWISEVNNAYKGLFALEDPTTIRVYQTEMAFQDVTVAGVPVIGYIDRVDEVEGGLAVRDYKGLALDTPIPTPTGWTTMGDLREDDLVLGVDGKPTRVVGKSSTYHRPCYAITFSDGSTVVCDNVHLWQVTDLTEDPRGSLTLNADELFERYQSAVAAGKSQSLVLPAAGSPISGHGDLPIDEWVLAAYPVDTRDKAAIVRKHWGTRRTIVGMKPVETVPTECIMVDAPDSLYLCGPTMVPTHNSGKVPNNITKFGDHQGDQLRIYTKAVEAMLGVTPVEATLLYTKHAKSRVVPISKSAMNKTLKAFAHAWDTHNELMDQASFTTKVGALCGWCPAVGACPVAKSENKVDRTGAAPDGTWLGIPTLRPYIPPTVIEEIVAEAHPGQLGAPGQHLNPIDPGFADEMPSHEPDLADDERIVTPATPAPVPASVQDTTPSHEPDLAPDEQIVTAPVTAPAAAAPAPTVAAPIAPVVPLGPVVGGTTVVTPDGRIIVVDADGNEIGAPSRATANDAPISVPEFATQPDETREPDIATVIEGPYGVPAFAHAQFQAYAPETAPDVIPDFADDWASLPATGKAADVPKLTPPAAIAPSLAVLADAPTAPVTQVPGADHHSDNLADAGHPGPDTAVETSITHTSGTTAAIVAAISGELMTQNYLFSEDKPFHEQSKGLLNGAAYASTAVFGLASLAYDEIQKAQQPLKSETIDALTQTLASVVLQAQYVLSGSTAYQDGLNTRLRGALRSVMDQNPLPWGQNAEEWKKWHTKAVSHVVSIANVAHRLYHAEIPANPWAALATGPATPIAQEFIA